MYIEYITPQTLADERFSEFESNGGSYRPRWLVRTSDWQKVPGKEAINGYCTLSYCWKQSGTIIQNENSEYICVDEGHHRLAVAAEQRTLFNLYRSHVTTKVTYEVILQRMCGDFNIDYLWYDKICIDQTNQAETQREINEMHLIYSNARYTVAMVPEIYNDDPFKCEAKDWIRMDTMAKHDGIETIVTKSLWWKSIWAMQELMQSARILFVGKNIHFWCEATAEQDNERRECDLISERLLGFNNRRIKSANEVLRRAHSRSSSKKHDRAFALANIFHDILSVNIDYNVDVTALLRSLYQQLAQHDLSVMCFGSILGTSGKPQQVSTMSSYDYLPSWTGIDGLHSNSPVADIVLDRNGKYKVDDKMLLHIKSRSFTIRPAKYEGVHVMMDLNRKSEAITSSERIVTSMDYFNGDENAALDWAQIGMIRGTACSATHYWKPEHSTFSSPILSLSLTEDCDECVIPGVLFNTVVQQRVQPPEKDHYIYRFKNNFYISPVLRKSATGTTYRAIGMILLRIFNIIEDLDAEHNTPEEYLYRLFDDICKEEEYTDFVIE